VDRGGRLGGRAAGAGGGPPQEPRAARLGGRRAGSGRRGGARRRRGIHAAGPGRARQVRFEIRGTRGAHRRWRARISPDGRTVAFGGVERGTASRNLAAALDSLEARRWPAPDDVLSRLIWSPDSRHMPSSPAATEAQKVSIEGGPSQTICDAPSDPTGPGAPPARSSTTATPTIRSARSLQRRDPRDVITKSSDGSQLSVGWPEFLRDGGTLRLPRV